MQSSSSSPSGEQHSSSSCSGVKEMSWSRSCRKESLVQRIRKVAGDISCLREEGEEEGGLCRPVLLRVDGQGDGAGGGEEGGGAEKGGNDSILNCVFKDMETLSSSPSSAEGPEGEPAPPEEGGEAAEGGGLHGIAGLAL